MSIKNMVDCHDCQIADLELKVDVLQRNLLEANAMLLKTLTRIEQLDAAKVSIHSLRSVQGFAGGLEERIEALEGASD